MASSNYHAHLYIRELNEYQMRLCSCLELSAFLMDCAYEKSGEGWHKAACFLMRESLVELGEQLPFPSEEILVFVGEVA